MNSPGGTGFPVFTTLMLMTGITAATRTALPVTPAGEAEARIVITLGGNAMTWLLAWM